MCGAALSDCTFQEQNQPTRTADFLELLQALAFRGSDPHDVRARSVPAFRLHDVEAVKGDTERLLPKEFQDLRLDFSQHLLRCVEGPRYFPAAAGLRECVLRAERHDPKGEVQAAGGDDDCGVETGDGWVRLEEGLCECGDRVSERFVVSLTSKFIRQWVGSEVIAITYERDGDDCIPGS